MFQTFYKTMIDNTENFEIMTEVIIQLDNLYSLWLPLRNDREFQREIEAKLSFSAQGCNQFTDNS